MPCPSDLVDMSDIVKGRQNLFERVEGMVCASELRFGLAGVVKYHVLKPP